MSLRRISQWLLAGLFTLGVVSISSRPSPVFAQEDMSRKVKVRVQPTYPDLARKMSISGTVKIEVVVTASGLVKSTKVLGGHPVLVSAANDAVKRWKFEPAATETTSVVEVKFNSSN